MRDQTIELKLMQLIKSDDYDAIKKILEFSHEHNILNINRKIQGIPFLIMAVRCCSAKTVNLFLHYPCININAADDDGLTAAYWAAMLNTPDTLSLLIECHAILFLPVKHKFSPVIIAAVIHGCIKNIKTLIRNNCNLALRDKKGMIALDHAISIVKLAQEEYRKYDADYERMQQAQTLNNPRHANFLKARKSAQNYLYYVKKILRLLLVNGAALGRDVSELSALENINYDGCYFIGSTLLQVPITNDTRHFENAIVTVEQLRSSAHRVPYDQLILRCSELLSESEDESLKKLQRLFIARTQNFNLRQLCLEQVARTHVIVAEASEELTLRVKELSSPEGLNGASTSLINPVNTSSRISNLSTEMLKDILTLSECDKYGSSYHREFVICENRLDELNELTSRLENTNNGYYLRNCRFSTFFIFIIIISGLVSLIAGFMTSMFQFSECGIAVNPNCTALGRCFDEIFGHNETSELIPPDQISECRGSFIASVTNAGLCVIFFIVYHLFQFNRSVQSARVPARLEELRGRISREDQDGAGLHFLDPEPDTAAEDSADWYRFRSRYTEHMQKLSVIHPLKYKHPFFQRVFPSTDQSIIASDDITVSIEEDQDSDSDIELLPRQGASRDYL